MSVIVMTFLIYLAMLLPHHTLWILLISVAGISDPVFFRDCFERR